MRSQRQTAAGFVMAILAVISCGGHVNADIGKGDEGRTYKIPLPMSPSSFCVPWTATTVQLFVDYSLRYRW